VILFLHALSFGPISICGYCHCWMDEPASNAAVLLASDRARMMTGTVVNATAGAALDRQCVGDGRPVAWVEVVGRDGERLRSFFCDLFGWETAEGAPGSHFGVMDASPHGTGNLLVMKQVKLAAAHRKIELLILPTAQAIEALKRNPEEANAILHVTY
jgi:predicted enzyme related to lactoylglutathione lyase